MKRSSKTIHIEPVMPDSASLTRTAFLQATSKALRSTNAQNVRLHPCKRRLGQGVHLFFGSPSKARLSFINLQGNVQPFQQESLKNLETATKQADGPVICEFLRSAGFVHWLDDGSPPHRWHSCPRANKFQETQQRRPKDIIVNMENSHMLAHLGQVHD